MKKILSLFLTIFYLQNFYSSAQQHQWSFNALDSIIYGGSVNGQCIAKDIISGAVFISGNYSETADFDPSSDITNLVSPGNQNIFLAKYDNNGNFLWAKSMGNPNNSVDYCKSLAIDNSGNAYITGYFTGNAFFNPSSLNDTLTSFGGGDIFIAKYDSNGNYLWAKNMGGTDYDYGNSIILDGFNNIYLAGSFWQTADFDPSVSTANLSTIGGTDAFLAKYDENGNYLWAKSIGGSSYESASALCIDNSNNIVLAGSFREIVDFDPSAGVATYTSNGFDDVFIAKYDANGNYIWAKNLGGTNGDYATNIAMQNSGNFYLTGYFQGVADFDPSLTTNNLSSAGNNDIFIAKYDVNGNHVWASRIGSTSDDASYGIAVDISGNINVTGKFSGTVDFDPSVATANQTSASDDVFIAKYNTNGGYMWAKKIGGTNSEKGNSIVLDNSGNSYIIGNFRGTADFDPSAATANLVTNFWSDNIFFAKYDNLGNYIWAGLAGTYGTTINNGNGYKIAMDNNGDIYVVGNFQGVVDFDPSAVTYNLVSPANYYSIFLAKYTTNGNLIWAKSIENTSSYQTVSIALDLSSNIYVTGVFYNTTDFDPSSSNANITSLGNGDIFLAKYDMNGNYLWAKSMGGNNTEQPRSITVDINGNSYISGEIYGTTDFDPSSSINNLSSLSNYDIFIAKYDANGNYQWAKNISGDYSRQIILDNTGNLLVTGKFYGTADFDPSNGTANLVSNWGDDIFLAKYDSNGNYIWAKKMGGTWNDEATSIVSDTYGNCYITGSFGLIADFDPSANTVNLTASGGTDIFLAKYNQNGDYLWAKKMGGINPEEGLALTLGENANIYVTGVFHGPTDFDPSVNTYNLYTAGNRDIFVAKYDSSGNYRWAKRMGGLNEDYGYGIVYNTDNSIYLTGSFGLVADFDPYNGLANLTSLNGSDVFVAKYNDCSTTSTYSTSSCDNYTWIDGLTYTTDNNTATFAITNVSGCDSLINLDLTILNSASNIDIQTACFSYTWIDGLTYTSSNNTSTYLFSGAAINGCDSIVKLDLTINNVNKTVTQNGATLTSNVVGGNYQWLDCDNGKTPINGAIDQNFTPTSNGNYALKVIENGCIDTTNCFIINNVSAVKHNFSNKFSVYPNPNNGNITINLGEILKEIELTITNSVGQIVLQEYFTNNSILTPFIEGDKGVYFIKVKSQEKAGTIMIMKQ